MCATAPRISLTAAGDFRDALAALGRGNAPAAAASLMAIDDESWTAMQDRLDALGGDLRDLLLAASDTDEGPLPIR